MKRREIFAGNWKMYTTYKEAVDLVNAVKEGIDAIGSKEVIVFPPSVYVKNIVDLCMGTRISVGVQNMYYLKEGAFTGEIAPPMVKDIGAKYVLIGHSERRHIFGEADKEVNLKVKAAFEYKLEPIICVGELLEQREAGKSEEVVGIQVKEALSGLSEDQVKSVIVAYEPVWAIGTGKVATPEIAQSMHRYIRDTIKNICNSSIAERIPLLYGGSVKPDNIAGLIAMDDIDGVLVGGASLKADSFLSIIRAQN